MKLVSCNNVMMLVICLAFHIFAGHVVEVG